MASIYAKDGWLYARLKGLKRPGVWGSKATGYAVGKERDAEKYAELAQATIDKRSNGPLQAKPSGPVTFRAYVETWLAARRDSGHDWKQDRGRLREHAVPVLGDLELAHVRPHHIAALIRALRFDPTKKRAQRTVRNVYTVLCALFRDAMLEAPPLVDVSPCVLTDAQLGPITDSDPEWRAGALFTRQEAITLISDTRIPADRRLVYGFGLLAGLRPGEAAALRLRHYDPTAEPLGRLLVAVAFSTKRGLLKGTKTESPKSIPVHPTLAEMLDEWLRDGWPRMMGRRPGPDDLIVPLPPETIARRTKRKGEPFRGYDYSGRRWRDIDLPLLGWRQRSLYDTKTTFITLVLEDGAKRDIIRDRVTHTQPQRTAFDGYDRGSYWVETCTEVAKLKIERRAADLATPLATRETNRRDLNSYLAPHAAPPANALGKRVCNRFGCSH